VSTLGVMTNDVKKASTADVNTTMDEQRLQIQSDLHTCMQQNLVIHIYHEYYTKVTAT